jgi:hypothetical protein
MKTLLSRSIPFSAFMILAGCASLPAQDPYPAHQVAYSREELDNLVAPVALYPDALLAQILVAATFPDQVAQAQQYVRERGTRNIDDQGWDISVKAVAYYPPILNMLATQDDWSVALGQAYAAQSGEIMDAVQRMREMAREQGNLVSTREHTVSEDRGRIVIVPANPQVIYVPTYDPAIVYVRPIWSFGFHTGYFSFGVGFPIGSWLVYEPDWWGHYGRRVYYHGWYGDGWRYYARRHFAVIPIYHRPRYSIVNINVNIFGRRVNYINLDRRHRYVRRTVVYERHYRNDRDRYADRDRWDRDNGRWNGDNDDRRGPARNDDRRGPVGNPRGDDTRRGNDDNRGPRGGGNDRIGDRIATFDDYRPDRGNNGSDAREAEPPVRSSGRFDQVERSDASPRSNGSAQSRSRPEVPVFTSPRPAERVKPNGNGNSQGEVRRTRPEAPVYTAPRPSERVKPNGNGNSQGEVRRSRPEAPVFTSPPRSVERSKPSSNGNRPSGEFRSAPRPNATYSAPQRPSKPSGGGSAQMNRPSGRSAPSVQRAPSGGGGGKVKPSGGGNSNRGGGGKGRKQ